MNRHYLREHDYGQDAAGFESDPPSPPTPPRDYDAEPEIDDSEDTRTLRRVIWSIILFAVVIPYLVGLVWLIGHAWRAIGGALGLLYDHAASLF